jgi:large subunit ribosomal protein L9
MPAMEVILLERIESLGQMGDVVKVKPGFARNFLLPQRKAMRATKQNLEHFEKQRTQLEAQNLQRRQDAEQVSGKMTELAVMVIRQAGETGQLYGSVTSRDIAEALREQGVVIDSKKIQLDEPLKALGMTEVAIKLTHGLSASIKVWVVKKED